MVSWGEILLSLVYRFGDFELLPDRYELRRSGEVVALEPRVIEVLAYLVAHRHRTVKRSELLDTLWEEEFVTGSALTRVIRELRKALDDSATEPRFLRTVYGRGYVFVGTVEERPERTPEPAAGAATDLSLSGAVDEPSPPRGAPFVGRAAEMERLVLTLEDAIGGRGRLALLTGEPGIGKTRTAQALAEEAERRGARVLWGRTLEGWRAPPYWPWVQIVRSYLEDLDGERAHAELGPGAADIAEIVPEVRELLPGLLPSPALEEPGQARVRLFDSVSRFLRRAAGAGPLMLVLDNLHWMGKPTLRLLEFLAHEIGRSRILVVGTYRDIELSRRHPLSDTLGELGREGLFERVPLAGLSYDEVAGYIGLVASHPVPAALIKAIHGQTEGNPFFLVEVVRLLAQEGMLGGLRQARGPSGAPLVLSIPEGVREVVGRRLNQLSDTCNRVLAVAAVVGRSFGLAEIERLVGEAAGETSREAGDGDDSALAAIEEAVAAGVVQETAGSPGRYQFTHALIRETLYDELSTPRRVRQHRRVGEVLEQLYAANLEPHLPQLAHHFCEAIPAGVLDKAIEYSRRAGLRALAVFAYEEAAGHFQHALEALDLTAGDDERMRCELLLELGRAQRRAGETSQALVTFERAAAIARRLGSATALAEAALGCGTPGGHFGLHAAPAIRLLEEALEELGEDDVPLRVRLLGGLASARFLAGDAERGREISTRAVDLARRIGDPSALLTALRATLTTRFANEDWSVAEKWLATTDEMLDLAHRLGETYGLADVHGYRAHLMLGLGRIDDLRQEVTGYGERAQRLRHPAYSFLEPVHRGAIAMLEGRFSEAERRLLQARDAGRRIRFEDIEGVFALQMFTLRRLEGRLGEIAGAVEHFVGERSATSIWRPGLAVVYVELGWLDAARDAFAALAAHNFEDVPRDVLWQTSIAYLADVAVELDDRAAAVTLYDLLLPAEKGAVTVAGGIACLGAAARSLARLAAVGERWATAERHFEAALELNQRMAARPWTALTREAFAAMLLRRAEPGDGERAKALLDRALAAAEELGMAALEERLHTTLRRFAPTVDAPAPAGTAPASAAAPAAAGEALSPREDEVLALLAGGQSNREIASGLGISVHTVASHVRSILAKTGSANRTEAAAHAIRRGRASDG